MRHRRDSTLYATRQAGVLSSPALEVCNGIRFRLQFKSTNMALATSSTMVAAASTAFGAWVSARMLATLPFFSLAARSKEILSGIKGKGLAGMRHKTDA